VTKRAFDDQLVAEALDYVFFVASARATRAKNAAAEEKKKEETRGASGASRAFAEATRAAMDSLELRADITKTSGLEHAWVDHPVLESLRAWMLERSAVADAVAERLAATFLGDAETERVFSLQKSAPASPAAAAAAAADAEKPRKEKTKAERRAAVREAAEREADARELAAINAVVGKASFGKRRETHLRRDGKRAPGPTSGDADNARRGRGRGGRRKDASGSARRGARASRRGFARAVGVPFRE